MIRAVVGHISVLTVLTFSIIAYREFVEIGLPVRSTATATVK